MADEGKRTQHPGVFKLFAEVRAPIEALTLVPSLPFLMRGPEGDGHDVIAIPPFGTGDGFTAVLRAFLSRRGFATHKWGAREILAFHRLHNVAVKRLAEVAERSGRPVSLVGHSLGGIYAREVARAAPEHVRRVVTVGSPFAGDLRENVVWPMYEAITGTRIDSIPDDVIARLNDPLPVPASAIYSRSDGVVSWRTCIDRTDDEGALNENIQVPGSHIGLLHNPVVLAVVAERLAQPEGSHEPFDPSGWERAVVRRGPSRDEA